MSSIITGSSGFIGGALAKELLKEEEVVSIGRSHPNFDIEHIYVDLADELYVKTFFEMYKKRIKKIYHFAANSQVKTDPSELIKTNLLSTHNLLKYCPEGIKFIFASSITVYGTCQEKQYEDMPCNPTSVYATTKLACEHLINSYGELKGIIPLHLRLGATIGGSVKGLVPDILLKLKNDKLELLGKYPGSKKPFTHIDDVVGAITHLEDETGVWNICNVDTLSVFEVANIIMDSLKVKKEIVWLDQNWKGDNNRLYCSNDKLLENFNFIFNSREAVIEAVKNVNI